ncbi:MAG TPA: hypothetical protein VGF34_08175 [Stellaceae bacterium]|jgi:hypothetical protein
MFDLDGYLADCRAAITADPTFNGTREVGAGKCARRTAIGERE